MLTPVPSALAVSASPPQQLPHLIGIGARKCGTSWLDTCLREHPDLYLPKRTKEVFFFDRYYGRGLGWYTGHFQHAPEGSVCAEVTPSYWSEPAAPQRIKYTVPCVQLVAMLRDPVQRAWSAYLHCWRKGDIRPYASFEEATRQYPQILDDGVYHHHLARWMESFPSEQIKVLISEEVWSNPAEVFNDLFSWIDVEPIPVSPSAATNRGSEAPRWHSLSGFAHRVSRFMRSRDMHRIVNVVKRAGGERLLYPPEAAYSVPELTPEILEELSAHYRGSVLELSEMLSKDLRKHWSV